MSSGYDPAKDHPPAPRLRRAGRRSIRLAGHDYAGGGLYFVTLCAHREFIEWAQGNPFVAGAGRILPTDGAACVPGRGATCVSPVREIIEEEWRRSGEVRSDVFPGAFVVMPDHFHGLVRIEKGQSGLGHVVGAFKAAVSRRICRGDTHVAPLSGAQVAPVPEGLRIWHRNYYEVIVRTPEAEQKITEYIRMNPWRCVQQFSGSLCGMGNPALWNAKKLGVLASRNAPNPKSIPRADVYLSGFHSPLEKEMFKRLLVYKRNIIWCPAWGCESNSISDKVRKALEGNRMLILEMQDTDGNLAAAEARNRFVIQQADELYVPHKTPGGMLDRLLNEMGRA